MSEVKIEVYSRDGIYLRDAASAEAKWPPGEGVIGDRTDEDDYCLVVNGDVIVARFTLRKRNG